jgi:hypothetical protein
VCGCGSRHLPRERIVYPAPYADNRLSCVIFDDGAASKRKGTWVGGPVPLGYAAVDKKIVVVPAEAEAAEAHWRWRGERSEPVRLSVHDHHRMLRLRRKSSAKWRRCERIISYSSANFDSHDRT